MSIRCFLLAAALTLSAAALPAQDTDQNVVIMDENLWVTFYDVPSRRFREIRASFVRRQFAYASDDLAVSASYLTIEADRARPEIANRLNEVADRMTWISENIEDLTVNVAELDALFGRAHWLLAQHYLDMAKRSRDSRKNRNAGLNLLATAHHMERAVLWSDSRISRDVQTTLENLRDLADQLQDRDLAEKAYREKPIVQAEKLLLKLSKTVDRPVLLQPE